MSHAKPGSPIIALMILSVLAAITPLAAQSSAHYRLTDSSLNASGDPKDGITLASANFRIKLDSVGEPLVGMGPASASFHVDGGYAGSYPPPLEVKDLRLSQDVLVTTLEWDPEPSATTYQVYRGGLSGLSGGSFGTCFATNLELTSFPDGLPILPGQAFFYLVTGRNRLREEGPKGYGSSGALEPNPSPCP